MRTTPTTHLRKRRAVSSILGTLIFIGILFTAVIPMTLVMKQADTVYTQRLHEAEVSDDERLREKLTTSAFPVTENSTEIKVKVENKGDVAAEVVRIWTNDEYHSADTVISCNSYAVLGPYNASVVNNSSLSVRVVTARGNVFESISGGLYFSDGAWFTASLGICTFISNENGGKFRISVKYENGTLVGEPYESHDMEWEDVIVTQEIPENGMYTIYAEVMKGKNYKDLPGSPMEVSIMWPDGPPFIMVYFSSK
jgi:flagellin-like protein